MKFGLKNHPSLKMPHNIDQHSVAWPGGGTASSFNAPVGMYGLILVESPQGLPKVDRKYQVGQGNFYMIVKYRERGLQAFDIHKHKAIEENATNVPFNGSEKQGGYASCAAVSGKFVNKVGWCRACARKPT